MLRENGWINIIAINNFQGDPFLDMDRKKNGIRVEL